MSSTYRTDTSWRAMSRRVYWLTVKLPSGCASASGTITARRATAARAVRAAWRMPIRRLRQGLATLPGGVERPCERIVAVHGGPEGERLAGQRDDCRARHGAGVRGVEEGRLEIGVATCADEERVLDADEGVGLLRAGGVAAR